MQRVQLAAINQIMCVLARPGQGRARLAREACWAIKSGQMLLSAAQGHSSVREDILGVSVWGSGFSLGFAVKYFMLLILILLCAQSCCFPSPSLSLCLLCVCGCNYAV